MLCVKRRNTLQWLNPSQTWKAELLQTLFGNVLQFKCTAELVRKWSLSNYMSRMNDLKSARNCYRSNHSDLSVALDGNELKSYILLLEWLNSSQSQTHIVANFLVQPGVLCQHPLFVRLRDRTRRGVWTRGDRRAAAEIDRRHFLVPTDHSWVGWVTEET